MALNDGQLAATDNRDGYTAALALHRAGRTAEARAAYDKVLAADAWHVGALLHAGSLAFEAGRHDVAANHCQSLLNLSDSEISRGLEQCAVDMRVALDFVALCEQHGRSALASSVVDAVRTEFPDNVEAKMVSGKLLLQAGRQREAISMFRGAADLTDDDSNPWAVLGTVYLHADLPAEALEACRRAIEICPDDHEARRRLAQAMMRSERQPDALREYRRLANKVETDTDILRETADELLKGGDVKNARTAYGKLLSVDPDDYQANLGLGAVLFISQQKQDAVGFFQHALSTLPNDAQAAMSLARQFVNHMPRVVTSALLVRAVDAAWNDVEHLSEIAHTAYEARFGSAALSGFLRLRELTPDDPTLLPTLIDTKLSMCEWGSTQTLIDEIMTAVDDAISNDEDLNIDVWNLFAVGVDYPTLARAARYKSKQVFEQLAASREAENFTFETPKRAKIRIGYMCPYTWHSSHIANLLTVVQHHDRSRFELYGYAIQVGDDAFDDQFRALFDQFRHTPLDQLADSARLIYQDDIDILIDSTGHFAATCMPLAAMRPAPIVMHGTAGFNIIGGAEFYDYSLNDRQYLTDDLVDLYVEKPFYMPHSAMPAELLPIEQSLPDRTRYQVPEDRFVFADFNHPCKYDPKIFTAWMDILRRVPDSVLLLCQWLEDTSRNLHRLAAEQGVDPSRVIFAPTMYREVHLRRLQLCDLALDTFYHCGGVTTVDCLIAGLPILTALPDRPLPLANRSLLSAMGCDDLVMPDLPSYVAKAVELANDPAQLIDIRTRMLANQTRTPLFQTERWVRNLERAFEIIHRNRHDGAAPAPFSVLDVEDWPAPPDN